MSSPSFVSAATVSFRSCPQQTERREKQKGTRLIFKKARTKKATPTPILRKKGSLNKRKGVGIWVGFSSPPPFQHTHEHPISCLCSSQAKEKEYIWQMHLNKREKRKVRQRKLLIKIQDRNKKSRESWWVSHLLYKLIITE